MIRNLPWLGSIIVFFEVEAETTPRCHTLPRLSHLLEKLFLSKRDTLLLILLCSFLVLLIFVFSVITLGTIAFVVVSTADIAEASTTSALHFVASTWFLNPVIAFGTLLKFLSADKLHELLIIFVLLVCDLILFAGLPTVIGYSAVETVVFVAHFTLERAVPL